MGACRRQCRRGRRTLFLHRARPGRTADRGLLRRHPSHTALRRLGCHRMGGHVIDGNEGDDWPLRLVSVGRDGTLEVLIWPSCPRAQWQAGSQLRVARHRPRPRRAAPTGSRAHRQPALAATARRSKAGPVLPEAVALFIATARRRDDGLAIAYHDRVDARCATWSRTQAAASGRPR